ncbi:unnamed protein product [Medioppia subpectinata]|uniref:MD-2-related lipid-recognition domain-containing protein n=1 Tax=Medioppia subpectinata TaxID=1979941 RepID=A0A7R9L9E2_9ACAR|nr:unnamed protein product [Medioppia subpectinata]CAG2116912.1 unnamed protein product [Medioppia subpectinata]
MSYYSPREQQKALRLKAAMLCVNSRLAKMCLSLLIFKLVNLDDPVPTYSAQVSWDPEPGTTKYDVLNSYSNACPDTPCPIHSGVAQKLTFNTALHKSQYVSTVKNATLTLWVDGNGDVLCSEVSVDIIII